MSYSEENAAQVSRILETKNFYEILQVPKNATEAQIKSSHKSLALQVHPDKNNAPGSKEAFISNLTVSRAVVRNATAVLLDKEKRKEYDDYLRSPTGIGMEKFNLSEDAVDAILITAGIAGIVGIAAGLFALYDWFTGSKKKKNEPRYS